MDDKKASSVVWLVTASLIMGVTNANAQAPVKPVTTPAPLTSTVSYDSLHMMAYSGQTEQAIKLAQEYLKSHESSGIRVLLARMLLWDGQFDAAREQLYFVLAKHPGDYDASDGLSDVEVRLGNYNRAMDVLTNALKYDPKNEGLLEKREIIRAKKEVSQGNRDRAIEIARDYLQTHDSLNMKIYLATQLSAKQQYDEARKLLQAVLEKKPSSTDASNELADVEIASNQYANALEVINKGLKYSPQNTDLLNKKLFLTTKSTASGKPANAAPGVTVSAPAKSANTISYDQIKKLSTTGQRKKAIALAMEALKQGDNTDIRILLGLMLSWESRYNEARTQFEIVLKKSPNSLDAAVGLANVELWSDHDKQALIIITQALKYHPTSKELLNQRNRALGITGLAPDQLRKLYSAGQPEKAKELAREYLVNNDNIDIRLVLAYMESWDSEYDDAKKQFRLVLQRSPGYADASLGLANIFVYNNDYLTALKIVNAGLKLSPNNADLLKKRADIIQGLNVASPVAPGIFSAFNIANVVGPDSPGKKMNAFFVNQEMTYVDDLKQIWKISTLGYTRYTPLGPFIFSFNQTDRFNTPGNQALGEAYIHLFEGAYTYLAYGYSPTSYIARNYIGFEPFFSLPKGFEFSIGERILQFRSSVTHLYTGSIAKYYGNYWFALRPYYTGDGSRSYYFTTRRYFSSPDSYIGITIGGGKGSNTIDLLDPDSLSANMSRTIRLNGSVPLTENFLFTWLAQYSYDHFPNTNIRQQTDVDGGFIWRF